VRASQIGDWSKELVSGGADRSQSTIGIEMKDDLGLEHFRTAAGRAALRVEGVSGWSIGMHIDHCCLAMIGTGQALETATLPPPRAGFSLPKLFVFRSGRIPRGRAQSPDYVRPRPDVGPEELLAELDKSERAVLEARQLDPQVWFRHFAFGVLRRDDALRFIGIHNRHHLKIIEDILAHDAGAGEDN
jgi:hypothetical protein